jgi:formylmethanofuran dehydrogenase subunit E
MDNLTESLRKSAELHEHLCPRQVLGVRMGLLGADILGLEVPIKERRLFAILETDGCAADGVSAATGCRVGGRTMRIMDYGKVAATFVDVREGGAVRIHTHPDSRSRARHYAPMASDNWHSYLIGYQWMPWEELLVVEPVELAISMQSIISRPGVRAYCDQCGEEIINEREVRSGGRVLCRSCAGKAYYSLCPVGVESSLSV